MSQPISVQDNLSNSQNWRSIPFRTPQTYRNIIYHEITFILLKNYGSLPLKWQPKRLNYF